MAPELQTLQTEAVDVAAIRAALARLDAAERAVEESRAIDSVGDRITWDMLAAYDALCAEQDKD